MRVAASELRKLSKGEREAKLQELARAAQEPPNGQLRDLNAQIRQFEQRYDKDSATMRNELASGALQETADICQWLHLLNLRDRIQSAR